MTGPQTHSRRWYGFEAQGADKMETVPNRSGLVRTRSRARSRGVLYWFATQEERNEWSCQRTRRPRLIVSTRTMPIGWLAGDAVAG